MDDRRPRSTEVARKTIRVGASPSWSAASTTMMAEPEDVAGVEEGGRHAGTTATALAVGMAHEAAHRPLSVLDDRRAARCPPFPPPAVRPQCGLMVQPGLGAPRAPPDAPPAPPIRDDRSACWAWILPLSRRTRRVSSTVGGVVWIGPVNPSRTRTGIEPAMVEVRMGQEQRVDRPPVRTRTRAGCARCLAASPGTCRSPRAPSPGRWSAGTAEPVHGRRRARGRPASQRWLGAARRRSRRALCRYRFLVHARRRRITRPSRSKKPRATCTIGPDAEGEGDGPDADRPAEQPADTEDRDLDDQRAPGRCSSRSDGGSRSSGHRAAPGRGPAAR